MSPVRATNRRRGADALCDDVNVTRAAMLEPRYGDGSTGLFGTELVLSKIGSGRPIPPNWHGS